MPVIRPPVVRHGNAFVETCSFSKAHGAAPQGGEFQTDKRAGFKKGAICRLNVGGSNFAGYVVDTRDVINEQLGTVTRVRLVDQRDDLFSITVFAQINLIDSNNGEIYSILEPRPPVGAIRTDGAAMPAKFQGASENGWTQRKITTDKVFPHEIIQWLCSLTGFFFDYTDAARARVVAAAQGSWKDSRYNVFNLDWGGGIKVGQALDQVCDLLGLQVTIRHGKQRRLHFSTVGENKYQILEWYGSMATSSEYGDALQPDVDTGVFIVGEPAQIEYSRVPLVPAWNVLWSDYAMDMAKAQEDAVKYGMETSRTVREWAERLGEDYLEEGFLDGKFFADMPFQEYIETIPFRVYRIAGISKFMTADEFNGITPVKFSPAHTPLLSRPDKAFRIHGHAMSVSDTKRLDILENVLTQEPVEIDAGANLREDTGHVVFDQPRFWFTPSGLKAKFAELIPSQIIADPDLTIDVVILGERYRKFFGTNVRTGSHTVSGLRKAYVVPFDTKKFEMPYPPKAKDEVLEDGEKFPDEVAEDIAISILERKRVVRSGSVEYVGLAGHEPIGEIQRVTVSLDPQSGFRESVSYANDEPSLEYEAQIELRRKIAVERRIKTGQQEEKDARNREIRLALAKYGAEAQRLGVLNQVRLGPYNKDNFLLIENGDDKEGEAFSLGQPVVAESGEDGKFKVVKPADVGEGSSKLLGISLTDTSGRVPTVTSGIAYAKVQGPVRQGQRLAVAAGGQHLKIGSGNASALATITDSNVKSIPVRLGGGESVTRVEVACATWGNTDFPDDPTTAEFDETDLEAEHDKNSRASVLVWQQDDPIENGIWNFDPNAEAGMRWTKSYDLVKGIIGDAEIFVRWGKKWGQLRFIYRSENKVIPVFDRPIAVDHGSYPSIPGPSGLDELATGYTPAEGDLIWVHTQGLYIAKSGDWTQIAVARDPETHATTPDDYASVISQFYERMIGAACVDGDVEGTFEYHEPAISPSLLTEAQ